MGFGEAVSTDYIVDLMIVALERFALILSLIFMLWSFHRVFDIEGGLWFDWKRTSFWLQNHFSSDTLGTHSTLLERITHYVQLLYRVYGISLCVFCLLRFWKLVALYAQSFKCHTFHSASECCHSISEFLFSAHIALNSSKILFALPLHFPHFCAMIPFACQSETRCIHFYFILLVLLSYYFTKTIFRRQWQFT